eukprot:CAMPEP_0177649606 /NCGR_PEP_ID=MMETSP0447-20121125/11485_1 /TAXON_ID=0 /ORGANISM="Stygamoeba regulata, Strain BSH-02190019" /LENGTH=284 /DNA_ID=CAMNT_0019152393 /DNA_START=99 /DNA_END=953 /DNA_ORIENTATION=+
MSLASSANRSGSASRRKGTRSDSKTRSSSSPRLAKANSDRSGLTATSANSTPSTKRRSLNSTDLGKVRSALSKLDRQIELARHEHSLLETLVIKSDEQVVEYEIMVESTIQVMEGICAKLQSGKEEDVARGAADLGELASVLKQRLSASRAGHGDVYSHTMLTLACPNTRASKIHLTDLVNDMRSRCRMRTKKSDNDAVQESSKKLVRSLTTFLDKINVKGASLVSVDDVDDLMEEEEGKLSAMNSLDVCSPPSDVPSSMSSLDASNPPADDCKEAVASGTSED